MKLTGFTEEDKTHDGTNAIVFDYVAEARRLGFYYPWGWIEYTANGTNRGPRLIQGDPDENKLKEATLKIIEQLDISTSELSKRKTDLQPSLKYYFGESETYSNHNFITNIHGRAIEFTRSVEGMTFLGFDSGGQGRITFGQHGEIIKMDIYWRRLKPFKSHDTGSPETIIKWIREGKAVQNGIVMNELPIDWNAVKGLTIKEAAIVCFGGTSIQRSDWLMPFVALGAIVERGNGDTIKVEIDCPVYEDETLPKQP